MVFPVKKKRVRPGPYCSVLLPDLEVVSSLATRGKVVRNDVERSIKPDSCSTLEEKSAVSIKDSAGRHSGFE